MIETFTTNTGGRWFEVKLSFKAANEHGFITKQTETFVVDGFTFADAHNKVFEDIDGLGYDDAEVVGMTMAPYSEIFEDDEKDCEYYFKVRAEFISYDERTCKEKKQSMYYLVKGDNVEHVRKTFDEAMNGTMAHYTVTAIVKTKITERIS